MRKGHRLPVFEKITREAEEEAALSPYVTGRPPVRITRPEGVIAPPGGRVSRDTEIERYWRNRASAHFQDELKVRQEARRGRRKLNDAALAYTLQALEYERSPEFVAKLLAGDLPRQKERDTLPVIHWYLVLRVGDGHRTGL